jgi:hypothetical protein
MDKVPAHSPLNLSPFAGSPGNAAEQPTLDPKDCAIIAGDRGTAGEGLIKPGAFKGSTAAEDVKAAGNRNEAPADHVVEVTDATFDDLMRNSSTPVFVDFHNPT